MSNYPKITIITPNYNGGQYLEECIKSIVEQDYPNLEYIIIDGGSTDDSLDIIKKYEKYITYWVSEPDNGMYDAIRKGFERSTGEIMAWLNSDDMYHRNAFFCVAEVFQQFNNIKWITGVPTGYNEKGYTFIKNYSANKSWSKFDLFEGTKKTVQQESVFWRRSLFEKIDLKIWEDIKFAGDLILWLYFFKFERLHTIPVALGGFRSRSSVQLSLVHRKEYLKERRIFIKKMHKRFCISEKIKLSLIFLDKFIFNFPVLRTVYLRSKIREKYFEYAPTIKFDRLSQSFYLDV